MSVKKKLKQAASMRTGFKPYQAPTSSAFGGTLGSSTPPAPAPTIPPPPASAAPAAASSPTVNPFFRPEDLITQNNFWAQWNGTFADLDHQLADLQTNTVFQKSQLADQHKSNVSGINDNAAARGVSQSSIRDGNQAQEQTNYTRADQNLTDTLNNFATYVQKVKNDFQTNTLPGFNAAEDAQAVQNAQDVPQVPAPVQPQVVSQAQQPTSVAKAPTPYKPVVKNGKFYHYYPAANGKPERWVYIRPASQ